jgi:hypothetical protein
MSLKRNSWYKKGIKSPDRITLSGLNIILFDILKSNEKRRKKIK